VTKFWRALFVILAVAFGIRVLYVAIAKSGPCTISLPSGTAKSPSQCAGPSDQVFYNSEANSLAQGHGFNDPLIRAVDPGAKAEPAADHPPLTVLVLAPVSWISNRAPLSSILDEPLHDHVREHRYTMVLIGTLNVLLIGLLGRRAARDVARLPADAVALVAAGIAAISPNIWVNDGLVMSETITVTTVLGVMLCAYALRDKPTPWRAVLLGAACGLAILARAEMVVLLLLLGIVIPLTARARRGVLVGASVATALIVVAPWVAFNMARFHDTTFISTNDGLTLQASNCPGAYYGTGIGTWDSRYCPPPPATGDQSQVSSAYRRVAFNYIEHHEARLPAVVLARVGRTWGVFRPGDMVSYNKNEGREPWVTRLGMVVYYPTLLAAVAGVVVLWRRRARLGLWVLFAPVIAVTLTSAATYGQTRFRAAAEPSLAILAAVGIVALVCVFRQRRLARAMPPNHDADGLDVRTNVSRSTETSPNFGT
jgi:hypothetical protein